MERCGVAARRRARRCAGLFSLDDLFVDCADALFARAASTNEAIIVLVSRLIWDRRPVLDCQAERRLYRLAAACKAQRLGSPSVTAPHPRGVDRRNVRQQRNPPAISKPFPG